MKQVFLLLGVVALMLLAPVFASNEEVVKFNAYTGSTFEKDRAIFDVFTQDPANSCFYSLDNSSFRTISEKINSTHYKADLKNLTTGSHSIVFSCEINNKNYSTSPYAFKIFPIFCGDGICSSGETSLTCSDDCGSSNHKIGDACYSDDSCQSKNCVHGFCRENKWVANDGFCDNELGENCKNSEKDCGVCPSINYQIYSITRTISPFCEEEIVCVATNLTDVEMVVDKELVKRMVGKMYCLHFDKGVHTIFLKKELYLDATGTFEVVECEKKIIFGLLCSKYAWPFAIIFALISTLLVWLLLSPRFFVPKYGDSEGARASFQHFINSALRSLSEEEIVDLSREKGWQVSDVARSVKNVIMQRDFKRSLISGFVFLTIVLAVYLLGVCEFYWISLVVAVICAGIWLKIAFVK
ncbi:MAG: hypothetical protein CVU81_00305 [Euryarchaeota archaeon HGW-Euryarchaeota-1]|nr:MAG: hypothetical protein CVU81_00305 [Euryarchaeota archaeon HGW-Euryarchaeota-1]